MPFLKIAYGIAAHIYPYGISLLDHWDFGGLAGSGRRRSCRKRKCRNRGDV